MIYGPAPPGVAHLPKVNGASLRLAGSLFGILFTAQIVLGWLCPAPDRGSVHEPQLALMLVAILMLPAVLLFVSLPRLANQPPTRSLIVLMLLAGIAMRVAHFGADVIAETDHFRYLWDGAVVAAGYNPHSVSPYRALIGEAPHLAALATRAEHILPLVNFSHMTTIYPGTAQIAFALAHVLTPFDMLGLRIVALSTELVTFGLLVHILQNRGLSPLWAAGYWLNPLIVLVIANQAHIDFLLPPLLLGALVTLWHGRAVSAAVLIGLAAGVKIWPLLLVPLGLRLLWPDRRKIAVALTAGAITVGAVLAPVMLAAWTETSGLSAYARGWAMNNPFYLWVTWFFWAYLPETIPSDRILRGIVAFVTAAIAIYQCRRPITDFSDLLWRATIIAAATFYLAPAEFPWYAIWFVPLAAVVAFRPLLLAPVLLPVYYAFFPLAHAGLGHWYHYGLSFAHGLPVLLWMLWLRRGKG